MDKYQQIIKLAEAGEILLEVARARGDVDRDGPAAELCNIHNTIADIADQIEEE